MNWKESWIYGLLAVLSIIPYTLVDRMTSYEGYWGIVVFWLIALPIRIVFTLKAKHINQK